MIFFVVTIICLVLVLNNFEPNNKEVKLLLNEDYSEEVANIKSLDNFKLIIKNKIEKNNLTGLEIAIFIDNFIRKKFFHGTIHYQWYENWVLFLFNFFLPQFEVNAVIDPNDIMKYNYAMCSQQSIIFQEIIKEYNFDYGSVRFNYPSFKHFANAIKFNNQWFFFDTNFEPNYNRYDQKAYHLIINQDFEFLKEIYNQTDAFKGINEITKDDLSKKMVSLSDVNNFPAKKGLLFHQITYLISWHGWIILMGFIIIKYFLIKKEH